MIFARIKQFVLLCLLISLQSTGNSSVQFSESLFTLVLEEYDKSAVERIRNWQNLITNNRNRPIDAKLKAVNKFFNRVEFVDDSKLWGQADYWATPVEFLALNAGDCEDFTIAKYVTLRELGVPDDKLRLMYVTATEPRQAHMVLAFYETALAIPLVLDNINKRILPASMRSDLIPIYSFNGKGLWQAKEQGRGRKMRANNNNKLWNDLQQRMLGD